MDTAELLVRSVLVAVLVLRIGGGGGVRRMVVGVFDKFKGDAEVIVEG